MSYILTVTLKEGLRWSDGTPFTSRDVVGTYDIQWARGWGIWGYLADVVARDERTVDFLISRPSPRVLYSVLRVYLVYPYSQYGKWMGQASELRRSYAGRGADSKDDKIKQLRDDLFAFRPDRLVVSGPFVIDPQLLTEAQATLVKNPLGYNADKIDLDKVVIYRGEVQQIFPLVLARQIDYTTHAFSPDMVPAIEDLPGVQIARGPGISGPGLWFNNSVYPLNKKEVRQAFAYIIDREENALIAMGQSGQPIKYVVGFPDYEVQDWLSQEVIARLNPYGKNWEKATELLTGLGFKKGAGGAWQDEQSKELAFELSVRSDYVDWLASAENAARQLNSFGIKAAVRAYPSSEHSTIQETGKYQILVNLGLAYYNPPHPYASYRCFSPYNNPEAADSPRGMNWPWQQIGPDGKQVNFKELIDKAGEGFDPEAQKLYVALLAQIYNEQLPVLPLFERYATDPIDTQTRITGWLPLEHEIYRNAWPDNYASIQLLAGGLKPVDPAANEFKTAWPYPQPPSANLNAFEANGLPEGLGPAWSALEFPPLFWYMWAADRYEPVLAEKYDLMAVK